MSLVALSSAAALAPARAVPMVKTALDDRPSGGAARRRRPKSMQDQGRKGHHVEGEPASTDAAAAAGAGADKIEDMATREKRLKRELNKRAAKFMKGEPVRDIKKIADRKTKAHVRYAETLADDAATNAALHEKWLLPSAPGAIEAEGMERTYRFSQREIADAVDVNAARKAFDLSLPSLGPYKVDFTPNGRDLLIGGRKGHLALVRWSDYRLISEIQTREAIRDVKFLHSGQFFAAAQKKYTYIYDNRGTEIHCLKDHTEVAKLDFLPAHFLLVSIGDQGVLRYQDTTYGKIVAQHRTKLGPCESLTHNPHNGVSLCGHGNGVVTLWSPNMGTPLVKMLAHRGPIRAIAMDPRDGVYVASAGADSQVKIFDLRTYKEVHSYFSAAPATCVDISQRGMLAVCYGGRTQVWDASAIRGAKAKSPYLNHATAACAKISDCRFCPYDDALGLGHSSGFSNLIVPGAGEPNYDSMVANPFETRNQRREQEVAQLMDKLDPETIQLDGDGVGKIRAAPKEVQKERREAALAAQLGKREKAREKNAEKSRMKGKNRISKRYRKKQQNVVDDKKLRAKMLKEDQARRAARMANPNAGDGPEGGGAMPGRTAGAASDAPVAPEGTSNALRRFYK